MKQTIRRALFFHLLTFFFSFTLLAQTDCYSDKERQDVGFLGGATFYMGDLTDNYSLFRNFSYYAGAMYRYNLNEYYTVRGQVAYGQIRGEMMRTDMPSTRDNGLPWSFNRPMVFMELAGEVGFMPLNVLDLRKQQRWSPYLTGGFGFASLMFDENLESINSDKQIFCAYLLIGVGVKFVPWKRITVGAEWVMRKTFSDEIDYYFGIAGSPIINKDWIGTIGISVTYRLKQDHPCPAYNRSDTEVPAPKKRKLGK